MAVNNDPRVKPQGPQIQQPPAPQAPVVGAPSPAATASATPVNLGKFGYTPGARFTSPLARPTPAEPIATSVGTRSLDEHIARAVEHFDGPADPNFQQALGMAYHSVMG
ncbi:MAG: hypothetical protein U1F57_09475 [bacterium]